MPYLRMLRGPEPEQEIELVDDEITIGRGRLNDIIIQDNEVSRDHCRLVRVLEDYEIHDLTSTNGTFVNGQPVGSGGWLLASRQIIELGFSITLEYIPSDVTSKTNIPDGGQPDSEKPTYLMIQSASKPDLEMYELDMESVAIGRDLANDIVIQETEMSRHHMCLYRTSDGFVLEDLNAKNGTIVDGDKIQNDQVLLGLNSEVRVGTQVQMWLTDDPDFDPQNPPPPKRNDHEDTKRKRPANFNKRMRSNYGTAISKMPKPTNIGPGLQPNDLEDHVLLVYARSDWDQMVYRLYDYLIESGIPTWVDIHLPADSNDWTLAFEQALQECKCLIVVISQRTFESKNAYIERSIRRYNMLEKPILFLTYETVENLPISVANKPTLPYDADDPMRSFRTLVAEIKRL